MSSFGEFPKRTSGSDRFDGRKAQEHAIGGGKKHEGTFFHPVGPSPASVGGGGSKKEPTFFKYEPSFGSEHSLDDTIASPSMFEIPEELKAVISKYPLFVVLLYRRCDTKLREFIHANAGLIDSMSGMSCLIWLPEPINIFSPELKQRWTERFGILPEWFKKVLESENADFEQVSFALAEIFTVPPETFPGFIIAEPQQKQVYFDRINQDDDLLQIFNQLVGSAQVAKKADPSKRTEAFKKEWEHKRYPLEKTAFEAAERVNRWCGVIKDLEKNILDIIFPLASLFSFFAAPKGTS